jgi:mevalonate kinase
VVSAPGKLILMGEHAAVYGRPALVAAIDLRLTAAFTPLASPPDPPELPEPPRPPEPPQDIELDLPQLRHHERVSWPAVRSYALLAREGWQAYARRPDAAGFQRLRGSDPAHLVKVALGEASESLGEEAPPGFSLRVDSLLPIGSGFGSSAATALAVVAGYLAFRAGQGPGASNQIAGQGPGAPLPAPDLVERIALEVERRQHGLPSGVDTAAILRGGLLWAQRLPSGALAVEPVAARSPLLRHLRVYDTGTPPEPTGAVVAAVRERRERDPARCDSLLDRIETATRAFRAELARQTEDAPRVVALLREHQACLEELEVVPGPVREAVRRVEAAGGAAKLSGAGSLAGPGGGCLLVYHPEVERVAGWEWLRPFVHHPVALAAAGLRREILR